MQVARWSEAKREFDASSDRVFRDALGMFGTGVTIITTNSPDGPVGMTANSFTSISLDPPLVMWSAAKESRRYQYFEAAQEVAIHVLAEEQQDLCWGFSKNKDAFDGADWNPSAAGTPLIDNCLARFECTPYAKHEAGDHIIVVLKVVNLSFREGKPLMFHGGQVGGFTKGG